MAKITTSGAAKKEPTGKSKKPEVKPKVYVINKEKVANQDIFRTMCNMPKESFIKSCKLKNKKELKAFLAPRYKGQVAQRIVKYFDFRTQIDYNVFVE
jgi:hypothetical protein